MNKHERSLVYTNALFFIPFFLAIKGEHFLFTLVLGIFIISSTLYHLFRNPGAEWWWHTKNRKPTQTFLLLLQITLAIVLFIWCTAILFQKSTVMVLVAFIIFIPSFCMFLSTNYKRYVLYHNIWHIASAAILTLAVI